MMEHIKGKEEVPHLVQHRIFLVILAVMLLARSTTGKVAASLVKEKRSSPIRKVATMEIVLVRVTTKMNAVRPVEFIKKEEEDWDCS